MNSKIGFITIGQSPRIDLIPDIKKLLNPDIDILEMGILDDYDYGEASEKFKPDNGDAVLVSRMRDGQQIKLGKKKIIPLIQESIDYMNKIEVDLIILLCTGQFPLFNSKVLLIEPQQLVHSLVEEITLNRNVVIIVPDEEQLTVAEKVWKKRKIKFILRVASPYINNEEIEKVALNLINEDISLVYMDCMGYSIDMKERVGKILKKPVLIPRTLIASISNELI